MSMNSGARARMSTSDPEPRARRARAPVSRLTLGAHGGDSAAMRALTNPVSYLDGVYAPVADEIEADDLPIVGELPPEIAGVFVQNNPNPRFPPGGAYHWFDGDGMVHGVYLRDGRASYRNRYVRTLGLARDEAAGQPLTRGILEPFDPARSAEADKNTANTDLVWHGGRLMALWWLGGQPYELSVPDLATLGTVDFGGTLDCGVAAHPKVDPVTGELIFFDYDVYAAPHLRYGVLSADGRVTHRADIELPGPRLLHDIAITERYTVFLDLPMTWDTERLRHGKRRVRFDADAPTRFGVLPRHGGADAIRWFEAPACYVYHTVNAYEAVNAAGHAEIVLTACRIDNPVPTVPHAEEPLIPRLYFLRLHPFFYRWRIDLQTGAVTGEPLDDVPTEFPRMDPRRLGRRSRYSYHPRVAPGPTLLFDGVIKYDADAGGSEAHTWGDGCVGGETVFVPRDGGEAEDDGYVMTYVTDRRADTSELVVLDARAVANGPIARVRLPRRVPFGFHAHWAPHASQEGRT